MVQVPFALQVRESTATAGKSVRGHNSVVGATLFPQNPALGATRGPALVRQIGAATVAWACRERPGSPRAATSWLPPSRSSATEQTVIAVPATSAGDTLELAALDCNTREVARRVTWSGTGMGCARTSRSSCPARLMATSCWY